MPAAQEYQKVTECLFYWSIFDPGVKCDLSSHAWNSPKGLVFFDPVPLAEDALVELTQSVRPHAIYLTNANHARSAEWYRSKFSIPIFAPSESLAELEIKPDGTLDIHPLSPELLSIPLTGGGLGETAYYIPASQSLILGDALVHLPQTGFTYLPDKYCRDSHQLKESSRALLELDVSIICFAHGMPIVQKAADRLKNLILSNSQQAK
ncbi:MAG: hypothetical protein NZM04_03045 [Methylacidiphilales bacterium]|nr:hypothetical protein [Candidatus Methylacidiphilales bacterium]MDW8348710.1 hypothetical protein [Verrucomicrobiae bacterium]